MVRFVVNFHCFCHYMIKRLHIITYFLFAVQLLGAQTLSDKLDVLLRDDFLFDSDASVVVYDLTADTLLYSHRENKRCRPASVAKISTVTAASLWLWWQSLCKGLYGSSFQRVGYRLNGSVCAD